MFCGCRADTHVVNICRGTHAPGLGGPATCRHGQRLGGLFSPLYPSNMPSPWDPAPAPDGSCLGPREWRR